MSILLNKVQRGNPSDKNAAKKWYPVQNSTGLVDETKVADLIADETTLNPAEALMAIRQFQKVLLRLLLDGHSVKLGNWGTFSITLNTKGEAEKASLTVHNILKVNIAFQPGEDLKTAIQKADFIWIENLGGKTKEPGGEEERPGEL